MTEYERLRRLALDNNWGTPQYQESTIVWFKYWKAKERGEDVSPPKKEGLLTPRLPIDPS